MHRFLTNFVITRIVKRALLTTQNYFVIFSTFWSLVSVCDSFAASCCKKMNRAICQFKKWPTVFMHTSSVFVQYFSYIYMCSNAYVDSSINQHHRLQKPVKYEVSIHFESRNISSLKALIGFWYVESLIYHFRECGKNKP